MFVAKLVAVLSWKSLEEGASVFGLALLVGPLVGCFLWFGWPVMLRGQVWGQYKRAFEKVFMAHTGDSTLMPSAGVRV